MTGLTCFARRSRDQVAKTFDRGSTPIRTSEQMVTTPGEVLVTRDSNNSSAR
jgi:hypothetical protein